MLPSPILILDFGSQYTQLIAKRIRQANVYCEVHPFSISLEKALALKPCGLILSGGPDSVYEHNSYTLSFDPSLLQVPVLGICYGAQWLAQFFGGQVVKEGGKEFGLAWLFPNQQLSVLVSDDTQTSSLTEKLTENLNLLNKSESFNKTEKPDQIEPADGFLQDIEFPTSVWMSHGDHIKHLPSTWMALAKTEKTPYAAFVDPTKTIYGVQFHPEVFHTKQGMRFLQNFLFRVCQLSPNWTMEQVAPQLLLQIQQKVGEGACLCGLSGGVDSMVTAALLWQAIGKRAGFFLVDTGLLRKNEASSITAMFAEVFQAPLTILNAQERFFSALQGVTDPEEKRKIIGRLFIEIFAEASQEQAKKQGRKVQFLAQGTIYPDVIESASSALGPSVTIKTHHNVGGLPKDMDFTLVEPLRLLFKDEVRALGKELGLPNYVVDRHPFPGPGLAIRILGEVTKERVNRLQQADQIVEEQIRESGLYSTLWQAFAVLLPIKSVGVMGDYRTYDEVIALRAVTSVDGMTADFAELPFAVLGEISRRIVNEVPGINRVVYDITSKPPGTIEWE